MLTLTATATVANPGQMRSLRALLTAPPVATVGVHNNPDVAEYARFNEFGTDTIPRRSFLIGTATMYRRVYALGMTGALTAAVLSPDANKGARKATKELATLYRRDVVNRISAGIRPANAPSTVRRKGFDHPLIETGELLKAITVEGP